MENNNEKIAEVVNGSASCALILDQNPKEESFLLKTAMHLALKEKGMRVLSFPKENELVKYYSEKWSPVLGNAIIKEEETDSKIYIKIPKKDLLIKELSYNEDEEHFSLIISPKQGRLVKEALIFEETLPEPDTLICFFNNDFKKLDYFKGNFKLPESPANLIFMPLSDDELFIQDKKKILTEKITDFLHGLEINFSPQIINLLFASLVLETNKFKYYLNKDVFSLANFLLGRGADAKLVMDILESQRTDSFVQILGRAAARTHYDEKYNALWTFLQSADFEKTNNVPSLNLVLKIMKDLESIAKSARVYSFFWQKESEIWIVLKSGDKDYLSKISKKLELEFKSDYLVIGPFENFSEAEMKAREALNNIFELQNTQ